MRTSGFAWSCSHWRSSFPSSQISSASKKAIQSPLACSMPLLRAAATPWLGCCTTFTPGKMSCISSAERSVEPSSTTMISMPGQSCASTERMAAATYFSPLKQGMTTEIFGTADMGRCWRSGLLRVDRGWGLDPLACCHQAIFEPGACETQCCGAMCLDQGALVVIHVEEHKPDIEVGKGVVTREPDGFIQLLCGLVESGFLDQVASEQHAYDVVIWSEADRPLKVAGY